ncbi:MAG: hypothetical protein LBS97_04395 [Treponema sp.]|jgi:hypothetical protein|nr:hypothetical protein [Treponema sp.]
MKKITNMSMVVLLLAGAAVFMGCPSGSGEGNPTLDENEFPPKADAHWNEANELSSGLVALIDAAGSNLIKNSEAGNYYVYNLEDCNLGDPPGTELTDLDEGGGKHVTWLKNYGFIMFPFPTDDAQFMEKVTKVIMVVQTDYAGEKKVAAKICSSTVDNYGDGVFELSTAFRDFSATAGDMQWGAENLRVIVFYFNDESAQLKSLQTLTTAAGADQSKLPLAFAFSNNQGSGDQPITDGVPGWGLDIKCVLFAQ